MKKTTLVTTVKRHRLILDDESLQSILRTAGYFVPDNAKITFSVPGGGDWSSCDIDVDKDSPVVVTWEETETIGEQ